MLPTRKDIAVSLSKELPKYLHKHEVERILDVVKEEPKKHLLISLLWQTGARVSEILNIRVGDIDFYARTIRITTLKQRKRPERVIPVQGGLLGLIGVHIARERLKEDDLLIGITRQRAHQIVREAVLKAGLDRTRAHPHVLRHSFAVFSVLSGIPIIVIKKWLGHRNINNTLTYMQVLGSDTRQFYDSLKF